eukprot:3564159-Rhodomonas_salina.1
MASQSPSKSAWCKLPAAPPTPAVSELECGELEVCAERLRSAGCCPIPPSGRPPTAWLSLRELQHLSDSGLIHVLPRVAHAPWTEIRDGRGDGVQAVHHSSAASCHIRTYPLRSVEGK